MKVYYKWKLIENNNKFIVGILLILNCNYFNTQIQIT